jgi:hypothetical protein
MGGTAAALFGRAIHDLLAVAGTATDPRRQGIGRCRAVVWMDNTRPVPISAV